MTPIWPWVAANYRYYSRLAVFRMRRPLKSWVLVAPRASIELAYPEFMMPKAGWCSPPLPSGFWLK